MHPRQIPRVLFIVGLATALSLIGDASIHVVLPTHTAEAGIALTAVGVMLSANRWVRLIANGVAGWASERVPRRRLFVPALFFGALSTTLYWTTTGYWPPPNLTLLQNALAQTEWTGPILTEANWREIVAAALAKVDWPQAVAGVRPFLMSPAEADLLTYTNIHKLLQ